MHEDLMKKYGEEMEIYKKNNPNIEEEGKNEDNENEENNHEIKKMSRSRKK